MTSKSLSLILALVLPLPVLALENTAPLGRGFPVIAGSNAGQKALMAKSSLESEDAKSLNDFFKQRGAAQNEKDISALLKHYDWETMITEAAEGTNNFSPEQLERLRPNMTKAIEAQKEQMKMFLAYESYLKHKMTRLELNAAKDKATVWLLTQDQDGAYSREKFWLHKVDSQWSIYDEEESSLGIRTSVMLRGIFTSEAGPQIMKTFKTWKSWFKPWGQVILRKQNNI